MDEITISGRTVEEAIEAGLDALGAERSEVDVQVIDEGVKGILGLLGTRLARVRLVRRRAVAAPPPEASAAPGAVKAEYRPATPAQVQRAQTFVANVCRLMGVECELTVEEADGAVRLALAGEQMGVLIGRRGQTLDALQYLTGLVANREAKNPARFVLDAEGYRQRRETALRRLAQQTAAKVKAKGHRVVLEPMSPQERRVVHLALAQDPEVYTYSEGEEPFRRVVVALREEPGGRERA